VLNIKGVGSGPRLNGSFFFNGQTILDDGAVDFLIGGLGQDWFWITLGQDFALNRKSNERVN
jgi:hypothetical protein